MKYRNKVTGVTIETKCVCRGENWQDVTPAKADAIKTENVPEDKVAKGKKGK